MINAYVALGSNVGDRLRHIDEALAELARNGTVGAVSRIYETAPLGPAQPDYLNACAALETTLTPRALLDALLDIERAHGRTRGERWGPRTLDLDLLLYGDQIVDEPGLSVPHPGIAERGFVLAPLTDVAGDVVIPRLNKTVAACLAEWNARDGGGVRVYSEGRGSRRRV